LPPSTTVGDVDPTQSLSAPSLSTAFTRKIQVPSASSTSTLGALRPSASGDQSASSASRFWTT
jgi:hypothetical protein